MNNIEYNQFTIDSHSMTDDGFDELLKFSSLARAIIAQSIRDIDDNNKTNQQSAKDWLYDDASNDEFSLAWCCEMLNMNMNLLGYSGYSSITKDHIRQKVTESSEARKTLLSALVTTRQSLIDDHRDIINSSINLDSIFLSTDTLHLPY